jgi:hypothetical protein
MILYTTLLADIVDSNLYTNFISSATLRTAINRGVRKVSLIDLKGLKRKSALSPRLLNDVYEYSAPTDLKGQSIIDIIPQINRGRNQYWELTTQEEFDRYKQEGRFDYWGDYSDTENNERNFVSIGNNSQTKTLLLSMSVDDNSITIDPLDSIGSWTGFGDGENLVVDNINYVKGSASINWDINASGGTTAGITNSNVPTFDVGDYKTEGYIFVWAYLSSKTNVTNFIIRVGSDSSNYYSMTATTKNDGTAFEDGWNLIRFNFSGKSTTGTPDDDACKYVSLYMTKAGAKVNETDYRFDQIIMSKGIPFNVLYYSSYPWQTSAGVWIANSTADTDYLNANSDEYDMYIESCRAEVYRELKDFNQMTLSKNELKTLSDNYKTINPSESLTLTNKYWDL